MEWVWECDGLDGQGIEEKYLFDFELWNKVELPGLERNGRKVLSLARND